MNMGAAPLALLAATLGAAWMVGDADSGCTSTGPLITITSARNDTGHVITTLRLQQETRLSAGADAIALDVQPTTRLCSGARTDTLLITVHTPPPPSPLPSPPPPSSPTTLPPPTTTRQHPGPGYENFPGIGYYKLHEEYKTWQQAKAICEEEDAHLLVLNSDAEAAAIQKLIKRHPKITINWLFIGFHDLDREGHYITIFGQDLASTGYLRWESGNPSDKKSIENCGTVAKSTVELNDFDCNNTRSFICEQIVG